MRKGFRPTIEPPSHFKANPKARNPVCCLLSSAGVITFVFLTFIMTAWSMYSHRFSGNDQIFLAGDQVGVSEISNDLSSIFCKKYEVKLSGPGQIYQLPHPASINQSETRTETFAIRREGERPFSARRFYLLSGSRLHVLACHENGTRAQKAALLVIQGHSNYNTWLRNQYCQDCILKEVMVPRSAICGHPDTNTTGHGPVTLDLQVNATAPYALVVHYARQHDGLLGHADLTTVNVTLNRTLYDLRHPTKECRVRNKTDSCVFSLSWDSDDDFVVDIFGPSDGDGAGDGAGGGAGDGAGGGAGDGDGDGDASMERTLSTKCRLRFSFWVSLFLLVPTILAFLVSFLFSWFLCRFRFRSRSVKHLIGESEVKVHDDACLVKNEVIVDDEGSCMAIQD